MSPRVRNLYIVLSLIIIAVGGMMYIAWKKQYLDKVLDYIKNDRISQISYYKVTQVYDGDTIAVDMLGNTEKIRLIGVDTPETHDPDVEVQCYGPEASSFTEINLLNQVVRLESDPQNQNRDRYNRLLRYVYLKDGTLWNIKLIENGYGFAYLRYPFTKLDYFRKTEENAKVKRTGLWAACKPELVDGNYQSNEASTSK